MEELIEYLKKEDYTHFKVINGQLCALRRFMFTTGLVVGLDRIGYDGRYCYESHADAISALKDWHGVGDPSGGWIKYKGVGGDRSNPNQE